MVIIIKRLLFQVLRLTFDLYYYFPPSLFAICFFSQFCFNLFKRIKEKKKSILSSTILFGRNQDGRKGVIRLDEDQRNDVTYAGITLVCYGNWKLWASKTINPKLS